MVGEEAEAEAPIKPLPAPPTLELAPAPPVPIPPPSSPPTATLVSHPHSLQTRSSIHMESLKGMVEGPSSRCVKDLSKSPEGCKQAPSVESVEGGDREKYVNVRGAEVSLETGKWDMEGKARVK